MLGRSFQLTDAVLEELRQAGLGPDLVKALAGVGNRRFSSKQAFVSALTELSPAPRTPAERKLILKHSRLGFLGLERFVPSRSMREWIEALVFALIIASLVRTFLFAPFKIPSGSMIPTIEIGDHIFATMFSYGLPIPFTDSKLFTEPMSRGDIVIFPFPLDPSVDYIKRVVALEGEVVEVEGQTVYIDGQPLEEPYAFYDPKILDGYRRQGRELPHYGPATVPDGHLFAMGDNRLNSSDSRVWGFVPMDAVKGKGQIVYWNHDPRDGWLGGYHIGRVGTLLH